MIELTEFTTYVKRTIIYLIVLAAGVSCILWLGGWTAYIGGWCIGCALNIVYFLMMTSRSLRSLRLPPERAVYFIRGGAVLRLTMIVLVLIALTKVPQIHFGAVVAGILSYRILIVGREIWLRLHHVWRKEV